MERTPGQGDFASEQSPSVVFVHRVNCWRRFAGARRTRVERPLADAASAHANYLDVNEFSLAEASMFEDPGLPGYTGEDPISRGRAYGYDWGTGVIAYWESNTPNGGLDAASYADLHLHEPTLRQVLLQPGLSGVGFGRSGEWAVADWHYDWPTSAHTTQPLIWPREDATNVPISAPYNTADGTPRIGGYAVSATVGSNSGDNLELANPLAIELREGTITGPDGPVEVDLITPNNAVYPFIFSVAVVPREPLEPFTTYDARIDLAWDDKESLQEWSFTTGESEIVP